MMEIWARGSLNPDYTLDALLKGEVCTAKPGEFPVGGHAGEALFVYFDNDGETYCAPCATAHKEEILWATQHWEGKPIECYDCNAVIEAYYGDPDDGDVPDDDSNPIGLAAEG